jgi:hypothetical protein
MEILGCKSFFLQIDLVSVIGYGNEMIFNTHRENNNPKRNKRRKKKRRKEETMARPSEAVMVLSITIMAVVMSIP